MNPYSGFRDRAYELSSSVLANVKQNIANSIESRGLTHKHFYDWMKDQGVKGTYTANLKRYPPDGLNGNVQQTDQLSVICLAAVYMEIPLEDVMFRVLTPEQHTFKRNH